MGSFRLTAGTSHLHEEFNFTESMLETVGKSLRHSCRSELTRQGMSLPPLLCHSGLLAQPEVTLIPKLRVQFAEFLQHRSLKRLGMLYQSTCVGFGYGLMWRLFPGTRTKPDQSVKVGQQQGSVTIHWRTNIRVLPIDYAFRPRLRGRLTLRRLTLHRNPWTFGDRVFHSVCRYSCQHSHFRCLQKPSRVFLRRPTERSATARPG